MANRQIRKQADLLRPGFQHGKSRAFPGFWGAKNPANNRSQKRTGPGGKKFIRHRFRLIQCSPGHLKGRPFLVSDNSETSTTHRPIGQGGHRGALETYKRILGEGRTSDRQLERTGHTLETDARKKQKRRARRPAFSEEQHRPALREQRFGPNP